MSTRAALQIGNKVKRLIMINRRTVGYWLLATVIGSITMMDYRRDLVTAVPPTVSPEQIAAAQQHKAAREKEFWAVLDGAKRIRANLNNPASFELVQAIALENNVFCYNYRATNVYGGVVLKRHVITPDLSSDAPAVVEKHCQGTGADHLREINWVINLSR